MKRARNNTKWRKTASTSLTSSQNIESGLQTEIAPLLDSVLRGHFSSQIREKSHSNYVRNINHDFDYDFLLMLQQLMLNKLYEKFINSLHNKESRSPLGLTLFVKPQSRPIV